MARKNVFSSVIEESLRDRALTDSSERKGALQKNFSGGALGSMDGSLADLHSRSIREIDPDLIDDAGLRDRLEHDDASDEELRSSIERYGQLSPVVVRPHPEHDGRYQIVFGRRRLRSLRKLKIPAKALVRTLDDQELVLAQGQENSVRKDPSFIEKAVFVGELRAAGYKTPVILDALNIDKTRLSRMEGVIASIPFTSIQLIGPAHAIGWRRWVAAAKQVKDLDVNTEDLLESLPLSDLDSDARFEAFAEAVSQWNQPSVEPPADRSRSTEVRLQDGSILAKVTPTASTLTLRVDAKQHAAFARWLEDNLSDEILELHKRWSKDNPG
ncbi:plasmid partitioning protein RepB [Paracoccus aminophilus]|uniref:Replication protein B n=1 Tax=Paracoccus aminophilus JCM 7686 TaxID=1367847 RepID=S5YJ64_PARAH|nr:plasmid partitioning protein RepB [Paracoccus aminophilus]AGT11503.1 replication protein B [Paracoccus aminophilus JCM 7686]